MEPIASNLLVLIYGVVCGWLAQIFVLRRVRETESATTASPPAQPGPDAAPPLLIHAPAQAPAVKNKPVPQPPEPPALPAEGHA